jgi:hypothetical protein
MTNTRQTQAEAFDHLLKTVLGWNDFTPAFVSIIQNGYTTITISLQWIMMKLMT